MTEYDISGPDDLLNEILSGEPRSILGYEGEIGAAVNAAVRAALQKKAQVQHGPVQHQGAAAAPHDAKGPDPRKWRKLPCPLPQTSITTGATATITATPQRLFRARFLVATESVAGKQYIQSLTVQGENQFVSAGSIPVAAFAPTTFYNNEMQLKTCDIGGTIQMSVYNSDTITATFTGTFFGEAYID